MGRRESESLADAAPHPREVDVRRALPFAVLVSVLLPMTVQVTGCSFLGYQLGRSIDRRLAQGPVPRGKAFAFGSGTSLTLGLEDGTRKRGTYRGVGLDPLPAYHERYRAWQASERGLRVPGPGDAVTLVTRAGERIDGEFVAFAYRSIEIARPDSGSRTYLFEDLSTVEQPGVDTLAAETLARLDAGRALPSRTVVLLEGEARRRGATSSGSRLSKPQKSRTDSIPMERVQTLTVGAGKAATTGLVLGLAVDMTLVAMVASLASWQGPFDSTSGCSSVDPFADARMLQQPYDPVLGRELEPRLASR
jgi:hypothetical protein